MGPLDGAQRTGLLELDSAERVVCGRQLVKGGLPRGISGAEMGAQVCRGELLRDGHALGVLVGGLGEVIASHPTKSVFSAEQGEQALAARREDVVSREAAS
jgi:hypothetical protein